MGKRALVSAADAAKALRNPGTSVRQAAEDAGRSRAAMRRAAARLTLPEQAYRTVTFGEYCIAIASVPTVLQQLCLQVCDLGDALAALQTQAAERPLNLVLSFDEATAGNVLAPDPQKKSCMVYACIKELGTQAAALRLLPPSKWLFDFLHLYTAGGCAAVEMAFLMRECDRRLQQAPEDFASLLRQLPWQTPSHVVGLQGPASRARLLQSARFPDKSYKGKAAHLMQLLPMIACLVELLDEEDQMAGPLASYECLLEIHRELSRLKRLGQISDTSKLQQLQRQHHDLCLTTYGKGILKPKHHWRHHAAKQIEEWGAYMDTSAFEAKHQAYKQTANKNFDVLVSSPAWSKAILDRMLCSCVDQMKVHFERRALLGRGKETTILWGQQKLRAFKQVQWEGLTWKAGDFQLEPFPGKVASTLRMQIWDGKTWQKLADIPKPPLWEIDNFGRPFVFKPPLEAMGLVTTARPPEQQQEAEEDFVNRFGISLPALVSICLGVGICGLLCLCVLCPILASPRTLNIFRMNAPERMDAKKMKQLDSILKMKREVKNLETQVQDHATTTDDWGMSHKVQSEEQRMLERQLDRKRKQQAKMERTAESGEQKEVKKEEQVQRKRADDERYRRMKEAYRPKTVAVDGVALRAPESVLLELGFEPEALEAFSMPGFSSMDADGNLVAAPEDEEEEEALENEDETGPPPPPDDEASEEAFDLAALQEAARNAKFDDAALRMPPELDEAPNIAREGAGLKRRGAMAGPKEGQPMDAELLKRAQRKAAGLKVGAEIHEENEVDKWIGPGSEPSSSRPDTSRSQASNAQLLDWDALDVDKEALKKEKIREQAKATLAKQRLRAITEGDKKDAAAAAESDDSQDEDIEVKLGRAAAPMAEGALMSVFIKKEPVKATREAREVQEPVAEPEELALPVPVPEVRAAGDAHETAAASSAAGSQQPYQGKVHGLSELPGCADDADQRRLAMGPLPLDEAALPDSGGEGRSRQIAEADGLLPADVRRRWGRSRRPRGGGRAWGRSIKAYEPLIPSGARSAQTAAKPQSRKAAHRVGRQGETSLVFVIWSLRVEPSAKRAFSESAADLSIKLV
eukprot:s1728_g11.t1